MSSAVKVQPCMGFGMRPGNEACSEICQTLYHDRFEEAHRYPERYRDPVCSASAGAALRDFRGGGRLDAFETVVLRLTAKDSTSGLAGSLPLSLT